MTETADVDCEAGRALGCKTFCCRLLVRLAPEEQPPGDGKTPAKGFVDKTPDGLCVNLDLETHRCKTWHTRPRVCREYDCNSDFLLQIALRQGFDDIVQLTLAAAKTYIPEESCLRVPYRKP